MPEGRMHDRVPLLYIELGSGFVRTRFLCSSHVMDTLSYRVKPTEENSVDYIASHRL